MDYVATLIEGLKELETEMSARVHEPEGPDSARRLLTGGYVLGMIASQISELSNVGREARVNINALLEQIEAEMVRGKNHGHA